MEKLLRFIFIVMSLSLAFVACEKDDSDPNAPQGLNPTQTQWGFVLEYTRVNCSTCGSVGGPLLHQLHDMGKVVAVALHVSGGGDPMESSLYSGFYTSRKIIDNGIPFFWVGDEPTYRNQANSVAAMNTLKAKTPIAGVDLSYSISGNTMSVKTKSKFFAAGTGSYYLTILLLETDIPGGTGTGAYQQAGGSSDYKHCFVLRGANKNMAYGEVLATNPAKDATKDVNCSFTLDNTWVKNKCFPVAIIWKYDASQTVAYQYINAKEVRN